MIFTIKSYTGWRSIISRYFVFGFNWWDGQIFIHWSSDDTQAPFFWVNFKSNCVLLLYVVDPFDTIIGLVFNIDLVVSRCQKLFTCSPTTFSGVFFDFSSQYETVTIHLILSTIPLKMVLHEHCTFIVCYDIFSRS